MAAPRIAMISALAESPPPAEAAMRDVWPESQRFNLLDDSLASDLAAQGRLTPSIHERFLTLGRYAAATTDGSEATAGILFTCSAFRPAIDQVKADLPIPVVSPNEGAFEEALALCARTGGAGRIGLVLTFAGSLAPLTTELAGIAAAAGRPMPEIVSAVADGALAALKAGDPDTHDRLIAAATAALPPTDLTIFGQFSMARAASRVSGRAEPLLTTPHAAVRKLRAMVEARR